MTPISRLFYQSWEIKRRLFNQTLDLEWREEEKMWIEVRLYICCHSPKKILSRTLNGFSAQSFAGIFKSSK